MCGIAGYYGTRQIDESVLGRTLERMRSRGPDASGIYKGSYQDKNCYLLHSRLSIIDCDPRSNQPFVRNGQSLVYNGEIYNYIELREKLLASGKQLTTSSDTEVLYELLVAEGPDSLKKCEGMWAFALFNEANGELLLSRDRFSEKPLFIFEDDTGIYFASEIPILQCLLREKLKINEEHLLRYLVNGYRSLYKQSGTYYQDLHELPSATTLLISPDLQKKSSRYWRPTFHPVDMSNEEAVNGFRERFFKSVEMRLRSDVPLAFCLSGGVDSSSIVSIASKVFGCDVATYSIIDNDPRYNEDVNISKVVADLKCASKKVEISFRDDFLGHLSELIRYRGIPICTISYYVHSYLSEAIAADGFKVVLSGTAADELCSGYYDHFLYYFAQTRGLKECETERTAWQKHVLPVVRNPHLQDPDLFVKNQTFRDYIYLNNDVFTALLKKPFAEKFRENAYCDDLLRNRMLNELFVESIPVILREDDYNSMKYSLENRSPFLDTELFSFCYSIPTKYIIRNGYGKPVLRDAMKGLLTEDVRTDRTKRGFNASIQSALDLGHPETQAYLLADSPIFDYLQREQIREVLSQETLSNSYSKFLFNFINAKIFLELNC